MNPSRVASSRLAGLARHGENGRLVVRVFKRHSGELVLADPDEASRRDDLRELNGFECMHLAAAATSGPPLVVEATTGDYVVLPDAEPQSNAHLPLNLDDAEVLLGPAAALGAFGRRSDDVVPLLPWSPDHLQVQFDPDDPAFADVPVVEYAGDFSTLVRGTLEDAVFDLVAAHLRDVDEPGKFGVFHNEFGEFAVYGVGESIEPHNDVRVGTVIDVPALLEGSDSLQDCAARLRQLAERMEFAERQGWSLAAPVSDGYAYPERAKR